MNIGKIKAPRWVIILVAIVGALIFACCFCLGTTQLMSSLGMLPSLSPTPTVDPARITTQVFETQVAEITPSAPPAITPTLALTPALAPTETTTSGKTADAAYIRTLDARLLNYREALSEFSNIQDQYTQNPALVDEDKWYFHVGATMGILEAGSQELANMRSGDESFTALENDFNTLSIATKQMTDAYTKGLDEKDQSSISESAQYLVTVKDALQKILSEFGAITGMQPSPLKTQTPIS